MIKRYLISRNTLTGQIDPMVHLTIVCNASIGKEFVELTEAELEHYGLSLHRDMCKECKKLERQNEKQS